MHSDPPKNPRWKNPARIAGIVALLLFAGLACNVPSLASKNNQEQDPGFVETSVVETMLALDGGQVQNGNLPTDQEAAPPSTDTPDITDTPTLTPTATHTPTPQVAMIYSSANTNCREGQGTSFAWLTSLTAGDEAEAVGVDNTGEYWYIRRPDQPNSYCWLWGKYATPSGPYQSLPVYTQVPTPTPGFDYKATYISLIGPCGGNWATMYKIDNIGAFTLESWKTSATDHTGGSNPLSTEQDQFYEYSGCAQINQQVDLTPGESYYLLQIFDNNPSGHDVTTNIKICTKNGLAGECLTKKVRHTP